MSTDSQKLRGKVAIVTGASKGIGAAIATHLGHAGASVVVNYSSSKEGADRVVADITSQGGKAVAVQANVSQKPDIDRLFAETIIAFGWTESPTGGMSQASFGFGGATNTTQALRCSLSRRKRCTASREDAHVRFLRRYSA